jgi:hypothetical protein
MIAMLESRVMQAPIRNTRKFIAIFVIAIAIQLVHPMAITKSFAQVPTAVTETAVTIFVPPLPTGAEREGSCWTTSIAVTRPGAYRCTVGNSIEDPCFAVPPNPDKLVCGANPILKKDGFVLKLTKPLPTNALPPSASPEPWLFKLADGSSCVAMTGTLVAVNGEPARWSCAMYVRDQIRRMGVVSKLTPGKVWMAERFSEKSIPRPGSDMRKVIGDSIPVKEIWE